MDSRGMGVVRGELARYAHCRDEAIPSEGDYCEQIWSAHRHLHIDAFGDLPGTHGEFSHFQPDGDGPDSVGCVGQRLSQLPFLRY